MKFPQTTKQRVTYFGIAGVFMAGLAWGISSVMVPSQLSTSARIALAQHSLDATRKSQILKTDTVLTSMPLPDVENATHRKNLFIAALLPLVVQENARIEEQRAQAMSVKKGTTAYSELADAYGLDADVSRDQLLNHIDIIPSSLTLAQAALESGWGTSRFAREGTAFFGERTFDMDVPGLPPEQIDASATPFLVKSFDTPLDSVKSYMKTLNTHDAYSKLRDRRQELRKSGKSPTGLDLVRMLQGYSEIGDEYINRISETISANQLQQFDQVKPAP